MIRSFRTTGTEAIYNGVNNKEARRTCPQKLWSIAVRKLDMLDSATELNDLRTPPGNRLESLTGDRSGQYSIRINNQYRICFRWSDLGPVEVEITDYH